MRYFTGIYSANGRTAKGAVDVKQTEYVICEAFSDDGVHWVKPELGLVEFQGSKANNIIPREMQYDYLTQDLHDPDPNKRYKAHVRKGDRLTYGMTFDYYYSPDGYKWTAYENNPTIDTGKQLGRWGPTIFMGWDSIRKVYVMHMENNLHMSSPFNRRSIGRAESTDMIHWSPAETIIVTDKNDYPDTEFYGMPAITYENMYVGFLWNFSTTNTKIYPRFAFSRDGLSYNRGCEEPIIANGDPGRFDSVAIYAEAPIVHNGEIFCYYTGTNWRSPEQLILLQEKATARIGLAKLPLDGFISYEGAREEFSVVTTRSFGFSGRNLYINIQAALPQWGAGPCEVRTELLDERHFPIKGFALEDTDAITTTGTNQRVSWKGKNDLSELEGRPVRVRISFKNAKLYAFQFR